jgi:hypothetical protein
MDDIIRDFIIIDDYLLVATDNGKLIKYKRDEDYKYSEVNVKIFVYIKIKRKEFNLWIYKNKNIYNKY